MSFVSLEQMPLSETLERISRLRANMAEACPEASGILVFSRLGIYHLSGVWASGALWVPMTGEPVLLCRKGVERAQLDSPLARIMEFKSYSQLPGLLQEAEAPLGDTVAVEMTGLSWSMGELLRSKLTGVTLVPGDTALAWTRAVKTEWELVKLRLAGARHDMALNDTLPDLIRPGMTEREIALAVWDAFYRHGHQGMMRMQNAGEEIFLGHVAAGDSANYPSVFNGPLGLRGAHPVLPFMGYSGKVWQRGEPLALDCGFCLEGYHTDKTQVYWADESVIPEEADRAQDFCLQIQEHLSSRLVPGAIPSELYRDCIRIVLANDMGEGFMGLGRNKVGFLGHGIGLAIDEWPVIAPTFDRPLQENMVLALEPKIGIAGLGMVGVENTFVVTSEGGKCLTGERFGPTFPS
jgi:Xaa-Pro aminopeptidase